MNFVFVFFLFGSFKLGSAISCHLCESADGQDDCKGASCMGIACIKREAQVNGELRIQKMCQLSGDTAPISNNVNLNPQNPQQEGQGTGQPVHICRDSLLWQGATGKECLCYTDWCNSAAPASNSKLFLFAFSMSLFVLHKCVF